MHYGAAMLVTSRAASGRTLVLLALILLAAGAVLMNAGHGLVFFYDEWDFILRRRGMSTDVLLNGHNGHLSIVPIALYKVMLQTFGLDHYWPYRLLLVALHLTACGLLFILLRARVGEVAALCGTAVVAVLGFAADDLVWAFQIGFVGSAAAGLGMLVALDRRTSGADLAAGALLLLSLASSSIGVPFLVVAIVQIVLERDARRFARVVAGPLVVYGAWRLGYGESDLRTANIDDAPAYAFGMLSAAVGGLTGIGGAVGPTLSLAAVGALLWGIAQRPPTARLLGLLAGALSLWGLTALARAGLADPQSARYVYASAVLVVLMGAELWPTGRVLSGRAIPLAMAIAAIAVVGNLLPLNARALEIRGWSAVIRTQLTAVEIAGDRTPKDFQPTPQYSPQILGGQYLSAVSAFGSPAHEEAEVLGWPDRDRHMIDETLATLTPPVARAVEPPDRDACSVASKEGVQLALAGASTIVDVRDGRAAALRLRRYSTRPVGRVIATIPDGAAIAVATTRDEGTRPWIFVPSAPVRSCSS